MSQPTGFYPDGTQSHGANDSERPIMRFLRELIADRKRGASPKAIASRIASSPFAAVIRGYELEEWATCDDQALWYQMPTRNGFQEAIKRAAVDPAPSAAAVDDFLARHAIKREDAVALALSISRRIL
jgi:hypothetical protein